MLLIPVIQRKQNKCWDALSQKLFPFIFQITNLHPHVYKMTITMTRVCWIYRRGEILCVIQSFNCIFYLIFHISMYSKIVANVFIKELIHGKLSVLPSHCSLMKPDTQSLALGNGMPCFDRIELVKLPYWQLAIVQLFVGLKAPVVDNDIWYV